MSHEAAAVAAVPHPSQQADAATTTLSAATVHRYLIVLIGLIAALTCTVAVTLPVVLLGLYPSGLHQWATAAAAQLF